MSKEVNQYFKEKDRKPPVDWDQEYDDSTDSYEDEQEEPEPVDDPEDHLYTKGLFDELRKNLKSDVQSKDNFYKNGGAHCILLYIFNHPSSSIRLTACEIFNSSISKFL